MMMIMLCLYVTVHLLALPDVGGLPVVTSLPFGGEGHHTATAPVCINLDSVVQSELT